MNNNIDVLQLILNSKKNLIVSIGEYRKLTGCGLKEAKDTIEEGIRILESNNWKIPENWNKNKPNLINCPTCQHQVSPNATSCPNCGEPINTVVKCPKCGSKNTIIITGVNKAASIAVFGVFAANKVISKYKCKDCKHKF